MSTTDDETAVRLVRAVAKARLHDGVPGGADFTVILRNTFDEPKAPPASDGDLARAALDVLGEDPNFNHAINLMLQQATHGHPTDRQYLDASNITLMAAALLVLQTRIKFKIDHSGKWSVEIEKKTAGDQAVKILTDRILSLLPKM